MQSITGLTLLNDQSQIAVINQAKTNFFLNRPPVKGMKERYLITALLKRMAAGKIIWHAYLPGLEIKVAIPKYIQWRRYGSLIKHMRRLARQETALTRL